MAPPQNETVDESWYDDGARTRRALFRSKLPDHLIGAEQLYTSLVQRGTWLNSKNQTVVHNAVHAHLLHRNLLPSGTYGWSDPFPTTGPTLAHEALVVAHAEAERQVTLASTRSALIHELTVAAAAAASSAAASAASASASAPAAAPAPSTPGPTPPAVPGTPTSSEIAAAIAGIID